MFKWFSFNVTQVKEPRGIVLTSMNVKRKVMIATLKHVVLTQTVVSNVTAKKDMKAQDKKASARISMSAKMANTTAMQTQNAMTQTEVTTASAITATKEAGAMVTAPTSMSAKVAATTVMKMLTA